MPEGYVDLDYDATGKLVIERVKQVRDPDAMGEKAVRLIRDGKVTTVGRRRAGAAGREHLRPRRRAQCTGDRPRDRERLEEAGVDLAPLAELRTAAPR